MADELFDTLLRFHREVVQPELDGIRGEIQVVRGEVATRIDAVRDEMATRIDAVRAEMATRIDAVRAEMATQAELQAMHAEMATQAELRAMRADMVTWPVLMKFFAEIVMPEIENVRTELQVLARSEMLSQVDGIYVIIKNLQTEYHALAAAVGRLEKQMAEQVADRMEVRSELVGLKTQVSQLSDRIAELGREPN